MRSPKSARIACGFAIQRRHFSSARVIVLAAGSAVANAIFCAPKTRLVLMAQGESTQPGFVSALLQAVRIDHIWVFGRGVPSERPRAHWDFVIDPAQLRSAIEWGLGGAPPNGLRSSSSIPYVVSPFSPSNHSRPERHAPRRRATGPETSVD